MTGRTIDQFMWGYQHHFRSSLEHCAERAFEQIGFASPTRAFLIGLPLAAEAKHPICIEPERGPLQQQAFESLDARTAQALQEHPDHGVHFSHPLHRKGRERAMIEESIGTAIAETLNELSPYGLDAWRSSPPVPVGDYSVRALVGVERPALEAAPVLGPDVVERVYVGTSLAAELIRGLCNAAYRALHILDTQAVSESPTVIVRTSAERLLDGIPSRLKTYLGGGIMDSLDRVSTMSYEGTGAAGSITFASVTADTIPDIRLSHSMRLSDHRGVRKLLEAARTGMTVLCDGASVIALDASVNYPDHLRARIHGRGLWTLEAATTAVLKVEDGRATLPATHLERAELEELLQRRLGVGVSDDLWSVVDAATASGHGTVLVIADDAPAEAQRLAGQSTLIEPTRLTMDAVLAVTALDGALLVEPDATCHSIGTILDGRADGSGSPSRGARFNSSSRYVADHGRAVAIVVSDDGMVDLVPHLRPRVSRDLVESIVRDLEASVEIDAQDGEPFGRAIGRLEGYEFYLSEEQCARAQASFDEVMSHRAIKIVRRPFEPDPRMDDSYFID